MHRSQSAKAFSDPDFGKDGCDEAYEALSVRACDFSQWPEGSRAQAQMGGMMGGQQPPGQGGGMGRMGGMSMPAAGSAVDSGKR